MRPTFPRRPWAHAAMVAMAVLALFQVGAGSGQEEEEGVAASQCAGDGRRPFVRRQPRRVEGRGCRSGSRAGQHRRGSAAVVVPQATRRRDDQGGRRACREVLAKPQFSMVIVRLTIPIGVSHDRPARRPGRGSAGVWHHQLGRRLLDDDAPPRGRRGAGTGPLAGPEMALAQGPIMIGTPAKPNDPKVGRVLGRRQGQERIPVHARHQGEPRELPHVENARNGGQRAFPPDRRRASKGSRPPPRLPAISSSRCPTLYHQNQQRFFRVVQLLQMIDSPELRTRRMAAWGKDLLDPATAGIAAMRLEGLGTAAVEPLKDGLKNSNAQVRYFSAEALAYLERYRRRRRPGRNRRRRAQIPGVRPGGPGGTRPAGVSS